MSNLRLCRTQLHHHIIRGICYCDIQISVRPEKIYHKNIFTTLIPQYNWNEWNIYAVHDIIVEAEMSQKLSWRDLFVQIELGVDIASLGIK